MINDVLENEKKKYKNKVSGNRTKVQKKKVGPVLKTFIFTLNYTLSIFLLTFY